MNLSNLEQRKQYVEQLGKDFIQDLRDAGLELSSNAIAEVKTNRVELGTNYDNLNEMDWNSSACIYFNGTLGGPPQVNIGSSGAFNPETNLVQRWRYIHAGQLASKWDLVVPVLDKYQNLINELMKIEVEK